MDRYRLHLVGPFGLFAPDGRHIHISSQRARALIALLVVAPGGVRSRRKLESMLWGSRGAKQAQDSLRRELSNLRQALKTFGAADLLVTETQRVAMAIDRIEVDVFALALGPADPRMRFAGDFLEGIDLPDCDAFEDWLREERERVKDLVALAAPAPVPQLPTAADVFGGSVPKAETHLQAAALQLPPKPSVAVLPFQTSAESLQPWLGVGLADEVSVCLSAFPQLFIVSSNAARALAEAGYTPKEIAQRLGVRYLLDGTVLKYGEQLRIRTALLDGQSGEQIWAESFRSELDDAFAVQEEIAAQIAPRIWTKVDTAERQRGLRVTGSAIGDYERYWRANALSRSWDRESIEEAISLSLPLAESDPTCPWATSLAAYCHSISWLLGFSPDREAMLRRAIQFYQAAMRFGSDNVEALGYCAGTLMNIGGDIALADRIIARALQLLPAHQPVLFWGGWVDVLRGEPERAVERFELALRVNPISGVRGQTLAGIGLARIQQGRASEALPLLREAERAGPSFPPVQLGLCVAAQLAGDPELARSYALPLLGGGGTGMIAMLRRPADQRLFADTLREAAQVTKRTAGQVAA